MSYSYDYRRLAKIPNMNEAKALQVLGFEASDQPSAVELKEAYRIAVRTHHPDLGGSQEQIVEINNAYKFLTSNPVDSAHDEPNQKEAYSVHEHLSRELKVVNPKKPNAFWSPGRSFVVNEALFAINMWFFSLLSGRLTDKSSGYAPAGKFMGGTSPEGLLIRPMWGSYADKVSETPEAIDQVIELAKKAKTCSEVVREELDDVERHNGVKIPENVRSKLIAEAPKVAARRWGIDRLRVKPVLVPFDGSKPIELR